MPNTSLHLTGITMKKSVLPKWVSHFFSYQFLKLPLIIEIYIGETLS